jgi:hypothetical protein
MWRAALRMLGASTGFESIGHSGPATGCFAMTALALFAGWLAWTVAKR